MENLSERPMSLHWGHDGPNDLDLTWVRVVYAHHADGHFSSLLNISKPTRVHIASPEWKRLKVQSAIGSFTSGKERAYPTTNLKYYLKNHFSTISVTKFTISKYILLKHQIFKSFLTLEIVTKSDNFKFDIRRRLKKDKMPVWW